MLDWGQGVRQVLWAENLALTLLCCPKGQGSQRVSGVGVTEVRGRGGADGQY